MPQCQKTKNPIQSARRVENFSSRLQVRKYSREAAIHYGQIKFKLEQNGAIIGPNDLLIASHARSEGLIVVTNNMREFSRGEGLRVENWLNQ